MAMAARAALAVAAGKGRSQPVARSVVQEQRDRAMTVVTLRRFPLMALRTQPVALAAAVVARAG